MKRSKHQFEYRPVRALGEPNGSRGNHQVTPGLLAERTVDLCVCTRCGLQVWTNSPTQARAIANAKGEDCDARVVAQVQES